MAETAGDGRGEAASATAMSRASCPCVWVRGMREREGMRVRGEREGPIGLGLTQTRPTTRAFWARSFWSSWTSWAQANAILYIYIYFLGNPF